jgi:glucose/arabinose dehydrogenase
MKKTIIAFVAALSVAAAAASASHTATRAWSSTVLASGLDSPRGLTIAPDGTLYVAGDDGHLHAFR